MFNPCAHYSLRGSGCTSIDTDTHIVMEVAIQCHFTALVDRCDLWMVRTPGQVVAQVLHIATFGADCTQINN